MPLFFVYVLQSAPTGRHYVGSTQDLAQRLEQYNAGMMRSTRPRFGLQQDLSPCPEGRVSLSGTRIREMLGRGGPPSKFSRPEVAQVLTQRMRKGTSTQLRLHRV